MQHFISGLPRSGSTLLASILRQNPDIYANIQSPIGQLLTTILDKMTPYGNEAAFFFDEAQRTAILRGVFRSYYDGYPDVVFDNNRRWCAHMGLLNHLFPGSRVIACVRPVAEIIDSFERVFARDPTLISTILGASNLSLLQRIGILMGPEGVVGYPLAALQEAYAGPYKANLCVIEYRNLITDPLGVLRNLHSVLGIPWYDGYKIDDVESPFGVELFDAAIGTPGLHTVKPVIRPNYPKTQMLPDRLMATFPAPFWERVNA